ncbi:uncharacterized protein LOC110180049 [Drosophila serrata]|uniref:uncharacterized protein LOC110180049 n=1 Tax=Drosophila serrata TaxID=7274 RepID=UPI000A1D27C8|nr:uncharacterized protein LOC110180049 [Drosophila serrata]
MSIILNVVQQYVLEKACDLTCEAALTVLRIWSGPKLKEKAEQEQPKLERVLTPEPESLSMPVPLPPAKPICQATISPEIPTAFKNVGRDAPRFNSGSIDPPQCSCMRVCRDSYFS